MRKLFIGGVCIFLVIFTASFVSAATSLCTGGKVCTGVMAFIDSSGVVTEDITLPLPTITFTGVTATLVKGILYSGQLTFTDPDGNHVIEDISVIVNNSVWYITGSFPDILQGEGYFTTIPNPLNKNKPQQGFQMGLSVLGPSTSWTGSLVAMFFP